MESKLEAEWKQWKEREQRYEKLFSPSVLNSREFLKEKLRHYDDIRVRVSASPIQEDRLALKAFDLERKELTKKIYPNFFRRLLKRMNSGIRFDKKVSRSKIESDNNAIAVKTSMIKAGLGDYYRQVQQQMKQGNREFSLPVSYQVNEQETMNLRLNFKRDEQGKYYFENYKAILHSELDKGSAKQQTFLAGGAMIHNAEQAYNLLAGRSVQETGKESWYQLDFNDKDAEGNYRMKHFPASYGFDLEKALSTLPLKEHGRNALLQQLRDGHKVEVTMSAEGGTAIYRIQADPLKKELAIYDNTTSQRLNQDDIKSTQKAYNKAVKVQQLVPLQGFNKAQQKGKAVKI